MTNVVLRATLRCNVAQIDLFVHDLNLRGKKQHKQSLNADQQSQQL